MPMSHQNVNCYKFDICNDHALDQSVKEPTRIQDRARNILDLVLSSHPNFIENCNVTAGTCISDHLMVCFNLNFKPKRSKKQPRKVFLYSKGDMSSMRSDLTAFQISFLNGDANLQSAQENWELLKSVLSDLTNEHIPSKMSKASPSKPWITRDVKRQARKKQKLFNKAKST